MKISIVNNMAPFIYGGAEFLADSLKDKLLEYGHEVEIIRFPFSWTPLENIIDSMMAVRLCKIENTDSVIALKFPAYYVNHPNKKLWLLHQFRQAYDLSSTEFDLFTSSEKDQSIKNSIIAADNKYLREQTGKIFTNSQIVSDRLMRYNKIPSEILFPPLMDADLFSFGDYEDYIFYPSRVNQTKRQYMAVEAMRYVKSGVRLVIAGKGDAKSDEDLIFSLIEKYDLQSKVTYLNRFISQQEKADLFKNCLGGIYIPYDEDSYGYVTLEAIHSGKAIISCTDAGGTYVVVKDKHTGFMTEPTPMALAEAMDKLYQNKQMAKEMGHNGLALLNELGINWDTVIRRLTK